jgi:sigma-B regulation protein RsbU (phosphoserine phosphatase)
MAQTQNAPHADSSAAGSHRPGNKIREFWQRVTEGRQLEQLWSQFTVEARESYGIYSREVDWDAIQQVKRWKRPFYAARDLFWTMLMKLSPARRVLLLLALVLIMFQPSFRWGAKEWSVQFGGWGAALLFLLLALELADRVTMKRDLEIAREIQHWLVPERPPDVPGVDLAFATRPANTVAGDYYDAFLRPAAVGPPRLLFVVADVAGKSVPAALLMATFQASLQALAATPGSLIELVEGLDRYASAHSQDGRRFTTAFLAELDRENNQITYVNAGHNAPILRRASEELLRLETGGLPLGLRAIAPAGGRFQSGTVAFNLGDEVIVFTDGMVEAVNSAGEEFSEARLLDVVRVSPIGSAKEMLDRLMGRVDQFVGNARQHDDVTCLVLKAATSDR